MNHKGIFALSLAALAALSTIVIVANANVQPPDVRITWLYALSFAQLIVGLGAYLKLAGTDAPRDFSLRSIPGAERRRNTIAVITWLLVLAVIIGLTERSEQIFPGSANIPWQLVYFLILIALPEEIIYRGIAFLAFKERAVAAVFVSAALFAFMHINNGLALLPYYFAFGILLGTLRHFGMSIAALALWHGFFNFVNDTVWPAVGFRGSAIAFYVVAPIALLAITALAGLLATTERTTSRNERLPQSRTAQNG